MEYWMVLSKTYAQIKPACDTMLYAMLLLFCPSIVVVVIISDAHAQQYYKVRCSSRNAYLFNNYFV